MEARHVERGLQTGMIEIAPLAFMRGRTLTNAVVLLDEAQNTTSMQMKMFLTRLGEGSRMIITGDPTQIDLPPGQYTVTATKTRYLDAVADVNVAVGAVTGNMYPQDLALSRNDAPVISNVQATNITNNAATITWTTDSPSSSRVEYGLTTAYGSLTPLDSTPVTSHSVGLSGLSANTLYHYRVISANAYGTTTSGDYTFTTNGPPQISNVQATNITASGATITWTTNAPADSQVRYGLTSSYGSQTPVDPANVTSHSAALSGLSASTLYHYQAVSANAYGTAQSADYTFTTTAVPTEILIDNTDPGWSNTSPSGNWTVGSRSDVPKIETNYLYTSGIGNPNESAATRKCRWTPDIGQAGLYGFEQSDVLGRVVLQIGVLDDDRAPAGLGEAAAHRRALAPIALLEEHPAA
jgi:hypothetical protein